MNEKFQKKLDCIKIISFAIIMLILFAVGLAFFARPDRSENEKRDLTKFPKFTISSFLSGEFTNQVSLWYSDTYPLREAMISTNSAIKDLYGIREEQVIVGSEGDDIPDGPMTPIDPDELEKDPTDDGKGEKVQGLYVNNNTAYQLFSFSETNSRRYVALINSFAEQVDGKAQVYDMIVPLHYQIALSDETIKKIGSSDCKQAIDYMYSGLAEGIKSVDAFSEIQSHNDEYLYYRTDHHWTALGAYYAFVAFCETKGIEPTPLESYEKLEFEGFLGTLYAEAGQPSAMKNDPDVVEAFVPMGTNVIKTTDRSGAVEEYSIVNKKTDVWYPAAGAKYNCFIAGDNPISEIHNPEITNGSSIVIIKESYGNAFVPFLVDSYEYVYVIDYRYWSGSLADFVTENGIDDVLFLNVVNITSTGVRLDELSDIIK